MGRRAWITFCLLQTLGASCYWMWAHVRSPLGPWMWAGSYVFLLPGNVLAGWPVTKMLWGSPLSPLSLQIAQVASDVLANGCVWLAAAGFWRRRQRVRSRTNLG